MMGKPDDDGKRDALLRLADMFDRSPVALTLADFRQPDLPLVVANKAFLELSGYGRDEVIGRNCRFLQADLPNDPARAEVRACIAERTNRQVVFHNRRKDGVAFDNLLFLQALVERDGTAAFFLGSQFLLDRGVDERRIERHLAAVDTAVAQAVMTHESLRAEQRRMLANAAHAVATAWLTLR
jgi:PAS domain S-box-containing protein